MKKTLLTIAIFTTFATSCCAAPIIPATEEAQKGLRTAEPMKIINPMEILVKSLAPKPALKVDKKLIQYYQSPQMYEMTCTKLEGNSCKSLKIKLIEEKL
jgi:hypothetical protein